MRDVVGAGVLALVLVGLVVLIFVATWQNA
jgi:hypothetical protein